MFLEPAPQEETPGSSITHVISDFLPVPQIGGLNLKVEDSSLSVSIALEELRELLSGTRKATSALNDALIQASANEGQALGVQAAIAKVTSYARTKREAEVELAKNAGVATGGE